MTGVTSEELNSEFTFSWVDDTQKLILLKPKACRNSQTGRGTSRCVGVVH